MTSPATSTLVPVVSFLVALLSTKLCQANLNPTLSLLSEHIYISPPDGVADPLPLHVYCWGNEELQWTLQIPNSLYLVEDVDASEQRDPVFVSHLTIHDLSGYESVNVKCQYSGRPADVSAATVRVKKADAVGSDAPVASVEKNYVQVVPTAEMEWSYPVHITCWGMQSLSWNSKVDPRYYSIEEKQRGVYYISTFTITEAFPEDTSKVVCDYGMVGPRDDVSISLFIHNGRNIFMIEGLVSYKVYMGDDISLDCRTTLPGIEVKLFKDSKEVTHVFTRDPEIPGWFVKQAQAIRESGHYLCQEQMTNSEATRIVNVVSSPFNLKPSVHIPSNTPMVVGYRIEMHCSLSSVGDKVYTVEWIRPDGFKLNCSNSTRHNYCLYIIPFAKKQDEGTYICRVSKNYQVEGNASITVYIKEFSDSYIEFEESHLAFQEANVTEGVFRWVTRYKAFPPMPIYTFSDPSGKKMLEDNHTKIEIDVMEGILRMETAGLTSKDSGNYTLKMQTSDGKVHVSSTFQVNVVDKPIVLLSDLPSYIAQGSRVTLQCHVMSFPPALVTWKFEGEANCSDDLPMCYVEAEKNTEGGDPYRSAYSFSYEPQVSRSVQCVATSPLNFTAFDKDKVVVSDINGIKTFSYKVNDSDPVDVNSSSRHLVYTPDRLTVRCGGLKRLYSDVTFVTSNANYSPFDCSTQLSSLQCLAFNLVPLDSYGSYVCQMKNRENGLLISETLELRVHEPQPPSITMESVVSLSGVTVNAVLGEPVNITCYVEGDPLPAITWKKNGEAKNVTTEDQRIFLSNDKQLLGFKYPTEKDAGLYSCLATNRAGTEEAYAQVTVEVPNKGLSSVGKSLIIVAVVGFVGLIVLVGFLWKKVKKEKEFRNEFRRNHLYLFQKGNIAELNSEATMEEQANLLPYDPAFEVEKDKIKLGKQLGAGAFGRVMYGIVYELEPGKPRTKVAVKMCKDSIDPTHLRALTLELKVMIHLGKHLNIVNLIGAYTVRLEKGELWILVEYCKYGSLLQFLQRHRTKFINQVDPDTGKIDRDRITPFPGDGVSPFFASTGSSTNTNTLQTDADGYLATRFPFPPLGRRTTSISSTGSWRPDINQTSRGKLLYVGNPQYIGTPDQKYSGENCTGQYIASDKVLQKIPNHPAAAGMNLTPTVDDNIMSTNMTVLTSPDPMSAREEFLDSVGSPAYVDDTIPGVSSPFTTIDLVCWAWQVANGMQYLAQRNVLHGDLAARNLLLSENNIIKISDFGLSKKLYENDVYLKKSDNMMPIKWMSTEAIQQRTFSIQSDIWAYGVVLWELFSLGNTPYPGMDINKEFVIQLDAGMRMDKPRFCTDELYDLMMNCWQHNPTARPTFKAISDTLGDLLHPEVQEHYVAMNDVYQDMNAEWFRTRTDYLQMVQSPNYENIMRPVHDDSPDRGVLEPLPEGYSWAAADTDNHESGGTKSRTTSPPGYLDMQKVQPLVLPTSIFSPRHYDSPAKFRFSDDGMQKEREQEGTQLLSGTADDISKPVDEPPLPESQTPNYLNLQITESLNNNSKQDQVNYINIPLAQVEAKVT